MGRESPQPAWSGADIYSRSRIHKALHRPLSSDRGDSPCCRPWLSCANACGDRGDGHGDDDAWDGPERPGRTASSLQPARGRSEAGVCGLASGVGATDVNVWAPLAEKVSERRGECDWMRLTGQIGR